MFLHIPSMGDYDDGKLYPMEFNQNVRGEFSSI